MKQTRYIVHSGIRYAVDSSRPFNSFDPTLPRHAWEPVEAPKTPSPLSDTSPDNKTPTAGYSEHGKAIL